MRKLSALAVLIAAPAFADEVQIRAADPNGPGELVVGQVIEAFESPWTDNILGLSTAKESPTQERGFFRFVLNDTGLHHYDSVYFSASNCSILSAFWFSTPEEPDLQDPFNAEARSAMHRDIEWELVGIPGPFTARSYYFYDLGCHNFANPVQITFTQIWRTAGLPRRNYHAPFTIKTP